MSSQQWAPNEQGNDQDKMKALLHECYERWP